MLRGVVSGRCPECGRAFDADDPRTTSAHPHGDLLEFLAAFVRTIVVIAAILAGMVFVSSAFGKDPFDSFWFVPWMLVLASAPLFLLMLILIMLPMLPVKRWHRAAGVVLVAVIASAMYTHWPLRINFALHKPALERMAAEVRQSSNGMGPCWLGIMPINRVKVYESQGERSVGIQLSGGEGGGTFLVQQQPGAQFIWYNSCIQAELGDGWFCVHED